MCVHVCICVGELCKIHMHVGLYVGREPRLISKMVLHRSSTLLVEAGFLNQVQSSPICSDLKFPIPPSKAGIPGRLPVLTQYLHRFWGYELLPVGFHDKQLVTEPALQSFPLISCPKLDSHRLLLTLASLKQNLPYNQIYKFKRTLKCCLFFFNFISTQHIAPNEVKCW